MKYLEFKGAQDAGHFAYYDKEEGTNIKFDLTEFSVTDIEYTVRGFDEGSNSVIYSNDIKSFNDEEFTVRSGAGVMFEGRYDKEAIKAINAKLHIKITGKQGNDEFALYLKGNNYFNFSNLLKELDTTTEMIKFTGTTDEKAGAVKYKAPIFVKGGERKADESIDNPF